jgi:hypothetical protein
MRRNATRRPRPRDPVDEHAAIELRLYLDNDYQLYQRKRAFLQNVARKVIAGKYDPAKAGKLWMYLVDDAAKKYVREFSAGPVSETFSKATREAVAAELARDEHGALVRGEYGDLYAVAGRKPPAAGKAKANPRRANARRKNGTSDWKNRTSGPPYNGHPSYAHWNAALWVGNEEWLYRAVVNAKKDDAVRFLMAAFPRTPDGVRMTKTLAAYAWRSLRD